MESSNRSLRFITREQTIKKARKKTKADLMVRSLLFLLAAISASAVIFIVVFIAVKGIQPFVKGYTIEGVEYHVSFWHFLFGSQWEGGTAVYGAGYIIVNTIYITLLSMLLTAPISILTALVIVKMSPRPVGAFLNGVIEILASVPSVIYGMFGQAMVTGWVKSLCSLFHYQSAGGLSTFAVVIVLTMMSMPSVTMLSITAIKSVNHSLELGSLALGASRSETNFRVVLKSAKSGIFAGLILGISRALGEATAVTMVCGNAGSGPNFNPFDTTRTLTTTMLQGLSEASGLKYDIKFSVGLLLIFIILSSNLLLSFINSRISMGSQNAR